MKKFILIIFILLLLFIIGEVCLDLYIVYFADNDFIEKYASITQLSYLFRKRPGRFRIIPHPYLGYFPTPNFEKGCNRHNVYGFRGVELDKKEPGEIWIACIGESTTYDYEIECWDKAYPAQLEEYLQSKGLKVRVINAGVDGWTSYEIMYDFLTRVSKFPIDYVIYYGGFNDLIFTRLIYPPPDKKFLLLGGFGIRGGIESVLNVNFWEWSSILRFFYVRYWSGVPHFDYFSIRPLETNHFLDLVVQLLRKNYPNGIFESISPENILKSNPPAHFRGNLKGIIDIARARNIEPIFVTYKLNHCSENNYFLVYDGVGKEVLNKLIEVGIDEMNKVIKAVANESSVPLFEFAEVYRESCDDFVDLIHNSEIGAKAKANLIGDFLLQNVISKK